MATLLSVKSLMKTFPGVKALDQLHLSQSRALSRNRDFQNSRSQKHPPAQLLVAFLIARHFYDNCYGERGYCMLCENSS